jgi:hypothetical protein
MFWLSSVYSNCYKMGCSRILYDIMYHVIENYMYTQAVLEAKVVYGKVPIVSK